MVSVETKLVGLLGYPLKQTFSPQIQNGAFAAMGLDYFYFPIEVHQEDLETVVNGIRKMNFAGFHVTKPNKIKILELLDAIDELAACIGAVNTVVMRDGKLTGYNTDGPGFLASFKEETTLDVTKTAFFIFGAGGAARAVATTLAFDGARKIYITDIVEAASASLVADINSKFPGCAEPVPFDVNQFPEFAARSQVLINASGVGMYPDLKKTPLAKEHLRKDLFVADCTYNPAKTQLLLDAEELGCQYMNGKGMVVNQGVVAFRLWTGVETSSKILGDIFDKCAGSL